MNPELPSLESVMTPMPWYVHADDALERACEVMERNAIRHLPVVENDAIVGVISLREAALLLASAAPERRKTFAVHEASAREPYVVEVGVPLETVLRTMAERAIGSALVTRAGRLAGIVTAVDACRAFAELLRALTRAQPGGN